MRRIVLTGLCAAFLLPTQAQAQARLLLGGGLSNPNGNFSNSTDSGFHGRVGLEVGIPVFPVSIRGEGEVHRFSESSGGGNTDLVDGTVSAVLSLGGIGLSPYVIAGVGTYRISPSVGDVVTNGGFHGGFGVSIGALGFGGFAEIRLVNINGKNGAEDVRYIPITVGVRF